MKATLEQITDALSAVGKVRTFTPAEGQQGWLVQDAFDTGHAPKQSAMLVTAIDGWPEVDELPAIVAEGRRRFAASLGSHI